MKTLLTSHHREAQVALKEKNIFDRVLTIFWLLGPFFMLLERTPGDVWLSIIAIAFVVRCVLMHDFGWLEDFWVKVSFAFLVSCILSGLLSADPIYSVTEALAWFRFPVFAMASIYWLGRDKRLVSAMLISTGLGLLLMFCILTAEIIIVGHVNGRLHWPYGDPVTGNYLAKVGLPVFLISVAFAVKKVKFISNLAASFVFLNLAFSLLSGERINFLVRSCAGVLAGLICRPDFKRLSLLILAELLLLAMILIAIPGGYDRYVSRFIDQLPTGTHSTYFNAMAPGLMVFESEPIFGIGPANYVNLCPEIIGAVSYLECHPHPHNFYIQLLSETGIIGLVIGAVFLWSIVWRCFRIYLKERDNVVVATAWIVPFAFFFPVTSLSDFFGQWNNLFMWSSIGLAMAASNAFSKE